MSAETPAGPGRRGRDQRKAGREATWSGVRRGVDRVDVVGECERDGDEEEGHDTVRLLRELLDLLLNAPNFRRCQPRSRFGVWVVSVDACLLLGVCVVPLA
eukprot:3879148-Rhodomonas_salina.1